MGSTLVMCGKWVFTKFLNAIMLKMKKNSTMSVNRFVNALDANPNKKSKESTNPRIPMITAVIRYAFKKVIQ